MINKEAREMIIKLLDKATILDIKENYNKGECERILQKDILEVRKIKEEIKDIFAGNDTSNLDINLSISCSFVDIQVIKEKKKNSITTQSIDKIYSNIFYKLPYNYTMGKKISKKVLNQFLEENNLKTIE